MKLVNVNVNLGLIFAVINNDGLKCRCKCKELIDRKVCDKGFIWNPSNCECECKNL